jgi:hypothetical protein
MTSTGPNAANSWPVVLQAVRALEPKVIPVEAAKIKAADAAAMRAVEAARKAQKRSVVYSIATLVVLVAAVGFVHLEFPAVQQARSIRANSDSSGRLHRGRS